MRILVAMGKLRSVGIHQPSYLQVQIASNYLNHLPGYRKATGFLIRHDLIERHDGLNRYELTNRGLGVLRGEETEFVLEEYHESICTCFNDTQGHLIKRRIFNVLKDGSAWEKHALMVEVGCDPNTPGGFDKHLGNMRVKKWVQKIPGQNSYKLTAVCFPVPPVLPE